MPDPSTDSPAQLAPPQPPLHPDDIPPVVHGIDDPEIVPSSASPPASLPEDDPVPDVRPADLAAFSELFARFHVRIERASAGRKYRPLRDAWDAAADEIARPPHSLRLPVLSSLVIDALRQGCESGKTLIVDACLDCIHRLFEYGHVDADIHKPDTNIALDTAEGALDQLVAIVCACLEVKDEDVFLRMVQTLLTASTRTKSGLHQSTLLAAVRTIYNIYLNARMPGTRTTARVSLTQILNLVFSRMEAETAEDLSAINSFPAPAPNGVDVSESSQRPQPPSPEHASAIHVPNPTTPGPDDDPEAPDPNTEFSSVLQKDAYLLFRALCKLSAKEYVEANSPDAVGIRSKLLSLDLIRNLITTSGPAFRSGDRFVYALRQYLARSLLVNCMWNSEEVMDISFDIFEILLRKDTLRPLLKAEITTLFDTVIFRFLESPTAGIARKRRALSLLMRLASDRQTMADLFLNYDCDMESSKIFERIVHAISAAARDNSPPFTETPTSTSPSSGAALLDTRVLALTAVVQVSRSLREWSKPIEDSKESAKSNGAVVDSNTDPEPSPSNASYVSENLDEAEQTHSLDEGDATVSEPSPSRIRTIGTSGATLGIVSEGSDLDTTRFEEALKAKRDTAEGVKLFNSKPKRGIEFLISRNRLKDNPASIAEFLLNAENLDATMIGEYLGDGGSLNINVMHAYTDMHDFTSMTFDGALRLHLSGFRLPGEAQKIDRIMEKFASRFCQCNPDIFANADAAYILAYSAIMLHTDAHNDTIKNKMTKEEFIRNNRGINDGGDLDPVFLGKLYDRITKTEIRLSTSKKDSTSGTDRSLNAASAAASSSMDPAQRARQFEQESERLMAQTKVLFSKKKRPAAHFTYYTASNVHLARLMFDTAWYPTLAAISLNLEESSSSDTNIVSLCLDGFRHGIAISSTFSMATAKDAFVSSLAKFTHLNTISEMRAKNVECVRMILAIAAMEGNNLGEQWVLIIRAVSLLEQIRAVSSGDTEKYLLQKSRLMGVGANLPSESDEEVANRKSVSSTKTTMDSGHSGKVRQSSAVVPTVSGDTFRRIGSTRTGISSNGGVAKSDALQRIDSKAASLATTISESEIERIFTNSARLSSSGVADFCGALCTVALEELGEDPEPRLFCVQKIVEMAYYNMDSRTRIQWAKIWDQMGPFFVSAMCHSNRDVAMYAIDALRQLASKFLEKDELSNFAFQKSFLKPFEMCFTRSKSAAIRELVLSCISQIVLARAANIKSGWKSVFAVISLAADDKVDAIMNFGWQVVESITRKYVGVLDDVFVDAITGITAYSRATISTVVSLAAIDLLSGRCAAALWNGEDGRSSKTFSGDNDGHIDWWFPLLTGLSGALQDDRSSVRTAANNGLYKVLSEHGGRFAPSMWTLVFRGVLSPIFDDVRHLSASNDRNETASVGEWAITTGAATLRSIGDVFVMHLKVSRVILDDFLKLIRSWILQGSETIAREGMGTLARLTMSAGELLSEEDWKVIVRALNETFSETMPTEILGSNQMEESRKSDMKALQNGDVSYSAEDENGEGKSEAVPSESAQKMKHKSSVRGNGKDDADEDESDANGSKVDFRVVRAKCVVQLLLIDLVQEVVVSFFGRLSTDDILSMTASLEMSHKFAHRFNADVELRYSLWRMGFMNQVPNLLKQETNGLMAYLRIMFWLFLDDRRNDKEAWDSRRLLSLCESVLRRYIDSCQEAPSKSDERREVAALSPVVCFIVNSMTQMSESQFEENIEGLYSILLDLLEGADDGVVRRSVIKLFRARISPSVIRHEGSSSGSSQLDGPQLPGKMRERIVCTKVVKDEKGGEIEAEICAALNRVGGVRSVKPWHDKKDSFQVLSSAPDEMLISGVTALPFVKGASVEGSRFGGVD